MHRGGIKIKMGQNVFALACLSRKSALGDGTCSPQVASYGCGQERGTEPCSKSGWWGSARCVNVFPVLGRGAVGGCIRVGPRVYAVRWAVSMLEVRGGRGWGRAEEIDVLYARAVNVGIRFSGDRLAKGEALG